MLSLTEKADHSLFNKRALLFGLEFKDQFLPVFIIHLICLHVLTIFLFVIMNRVKMKMSVATFLWWLLIVLFKWYYNVYLFLP